MTQGKAILKSVKLTEQEAYDLNLIIAKKGMKGGIAGLMRAMLQKFIAENKEA